MPDAAYAALFNGNGDRVLDKGADAARDANFNLIGNSNGNATQSRPFDFSLYGFENRLLEHLWDFYPIEYCPIDRNVANSFLVDRTSERFLDVFGVNLWLEFSDCSNASLVDRSGFLDGSHYRNLFRFNVRHTLFNFDVFDASSNYGNFLCVSLNSWYRSLNSHNFFDFAIPDQFNFFFVLNYFLNRDTLNNGNSFWP